MTVIIIQAFPSLYKAVEDDHFKGNFLIVAARLDDETLARELVGVWNSLPMNEWAFL
jgi:hypothetical protein